LLDNDEPATYAEAMRDNQVWNLVDQPDGVKTIECKWIYKKKNDMDGNVHIYKARLVAK
jgi:histone deacetylase 1/2